MSQRFMIFPYKSASQGAKALAEELDGKRIRRQNSTYVPRDDDVIINWGASDCPFPQALNYGTKEVTNKIKFFEKLKGTGLTPRSTTSIEAAEFMNFPVFCRTVVEGHDGEGIVVAQDADELVDAKLYVEGIDKVKEFRVHAGRAPNGEIMLIGAQRKRIGDTGALVDAHVWAGDATHFVWTVNGIEVETTFTPEQEGVIYQVFGYFPEMTFLALDVVEDSAGRWYVLEANSAPTMTPKTTEKYGEFFRLWKKPEEGGESIIAAASAPAAFSFSVEADNNSILDNIKAVLMSIPGVQVNFQ